MAILKVLYHDASATNFTFVRPAKSKTENVMGNLITSSGMMSDNKKPAMLSLEPSDKLVFEGPFKRIVGKKLVIGNPSKIRSVAFKLKTNTPRMFIVRPCIGVLGPDEKVSVDVFMKSTLIADQKGLRILIQAAMVFGNVTDLHEFWKVQKSTNIWDAKIMCEIVPNKPAMEPLLQAGGDAKGAPDANEGEMEFDVQEVSETVDKLISEVGKVNDDSLSFIEKVDVFCKPDMAKDRNYQGKTLPLVLCALFILSAMVGAYCAQKYF